jgi:predicted nucleotidyltransferase
MSSEFRFYRKKEGVEEKIRQVLEKEDVLLAVIFGSFVEMDSFRDVDVAVYSTNKNLKFYLRLGVRLEDELSLPVDVVPIDFLPAKFRHYVLTKGKVILEKQPGLYEALFLNTLDEISLLENSA